MYVSRSRTPSPPPPPHPPSLPPSFAPHQTATAQAAHPQANKIITVFGNGTNDNRGRKLVINRRTAPSYDRVLDMLSKLIELPGGVRKLYTLPDCKLIKSLEMLSGCASTDFVAVGNAALDRSKLHTLGGGGGISTSPVSSAGPKSAKGKGKAGSTNSTPRSSAKRKSSDLNKHKQLPGITPAADGKAGAAKQQEKENTASGSINKADPLPGIDGKAAEDELQSSTKLQPVGSAFLDGDHRPAGNVEFVAGELINAADEADKALDQERDRQRRAHEERMATRQHARETEQTRKLEAYAEGAEKVDSTINEERARQKKEFQRKLSLRMRTNDKLGKGAKTTTTISLAEKEEKAATTIQATYRGHLTRKAMPQIKQQQATKERKKEKEKGKKKKKKKSKSKSKSQSSPPPSDKAAASPAAAAAAAAAAADPSGPMTSKELLAVKRIPTPDLTISADEIEGLQNAAATKIQAGFRGHRARKTNGAPPKMAARLKREQEKKDALAAAEKAKRDKAAAAANPPPSAAASSSSPDGKAAKDSKKEKKEKKEKKKKKKKDKETKKKKKKGSDAEVPVSDETPASPGSGETQATKLERQTSRFSTKGIEERSKVEESYTIGKKIGDGNFAVVKECTKKDTGEKFALKIIDKSKTRGAKETKMIENEVQTMKSVKHPNCVGLYDVYDTKEELFLVMELVSGGDLFDRIVEKSKYKESDAVRLVRNMATAINHLHEQNIIHRDLKPENLLVTQDDMGRDTLKLADFGLSMVVKGPLRTICGTPTYVAPEIISESPEGYGLQVDLWATGVIAYIMLCGFPPFASQSKNQKDLFRKIKAGKFSFPNPYWKDISEDAKDLISNLLKVNPDERFTAQQLLAHPWIANTDGEATNL